jgi:ATP-dependent exoDNAse (exonuclease V) beta subunit
VLLAPDPGDEYAPLGYHPGSIDLLYRDPRDGRIVVVDYKTDRAENVEALAARMAKHREQGAIYRRAIREALCLPYTPRFELWFLRADHIEVLP